MKKIILFLILILSISLVYAINDFDNDGIPDSWEKKYDLKYDVNDADEDPDNDGLTNLEEYKQGTNPLMADKVKKDFSISKFFKDNGFTILFVIVVLIIIFLAYIVFREFLILQQKRKKVKEKPKVEKRYFFEPVIRRFEAPIPVKKKKGERKKKNLKRKSRERFHLTERFREEIIDDIDFLPFSMSRKLRKIKEGFGVKNKDDKTNVFDKLPKRK